MCICVDVCRCIYVCMYYMCIHMCAWWCVYVCVCVCACVRVMHTVSLVYMQYVCDVACIVYICASMCACVPWEYIYILFTYKISKYICIYVHTCALFMSAMYECNAFYIYVHVCAYVCICIYCVGINEGSQYAQVRNMSLDTFKIFHKAHSFKVFLVVVVVIVHLFYSYYWINSLIHWMSESVSLVVYLNKITSLAGSLSISSNLLSHNMKFQFHLLD